MDLEKLTVEELLKRYERLAKKSQYYLNDEDDEYKEKVKGELLKRLEERSVRIFLCNIVYSIKPSSKIEYLWIKFANLISQKRYIYFVKLTNNKLHRSIIKGVFL